MLVPWLQRLSALAMPFPQHKSILDNLRARRLFQPLPFLTLPCTQRGSLLTVFVFRFLVCSDEPTGRLALVFELMDMNMYEAIKGRRHYLPE